jgi:hypothetical protein
LYYSLILKEFFDKLLKRLALQLRGVGGYGTGGRKKSYLPPVSIILLLNNSIVLIGLCLKSPETFDIFVFVNAVTTIGMFALHLQTTISASNILVFEKVNCKPFLCSCSYSTSAQSQLNRSTLKQI